MEDTELEEGEACSYPNDPDIDFPYIEEKLQNILGHFQKDFEGGVSAENLGAKFGGYGSFLPTYPRSPAWSHPRTHVQTRAASASPSNLELAQRGHMVNVSQLARPGPASSSNTAVPVSKSSTDLAKQKARPKSNHAEKIASGQKLAKKKSCSLPDQKMLKVRIKVGSGNLMAGKNAAIYTGLGLDVSPSSSPSNSASESEGNYFQPLYSPLESPTSILMVMTSLPVTRELLLSPLSDDLIHLSKQEKLLEEENWMPSSQLGHGSSGVGKENSGSRRVDKRILKEKKVKSAFRKNHRKEMQSLDEEGEMGVDHIPCEELLQKTMELPFLSGSHTDATDPTKTFAEVADSSRDKMKHTRGKTLNDMQHDLDLVAGREVDKKTSSLGDATGNRQKEICRKGGRSSNSTLKDANITEKKSLDMEVLESSKMKSSLGDVKKERDDTEPPKEKDCDLGGKKTLNGNKILGRNDISSPSMPKMSARMEYDALRRVSEELKSHTDTRKVEDKYKDFFGDMVDSEEEDQINFSVTNQKNEERTPGLKSALKERTGSKKPETFLSEAPKREIPTKAPPALANRSGYDAVHSTSAPVMIKDHWVCCDKCHKWRLLPVGMNPDNFPEKWLCSMMNWLPGLNKCRISQDETTNALISMYHIAPPQNQDSASASLDGAISQCKEPDAWQNEEGLQNFSSQKVSNSGGRKKGMKEVAGVTDTEGCTAKKCLPSKSKSSDSSAERQKQHMQKEKSKIAEQLFVGGSGDAKIPKMKNKREDDQDSFRTPKKIKSERVQPSNGDWRSEPGEAMRKDRPNSSSGIQKDSEFDEKSQIPVHCRGPKDSVLSPPSQGDFFKSDNSDGMRKKKGKEGEEFINSAKSTDDALPKRRLKEQSDNEHRKDKRAKNSKSDGKESSASRGSIKSNKKASQKKKPRQGQESTFSQRRDPGIGQLSAAANSSSSKISDSHKTKTSFHDTKGSPVESVSSSPMRISELDKTATAAWNFSGKTEPYDSNRSMAVHIKRNSEGKDCVSGDKTELTRVEKGKGSSSLSKEKLHTIKSLENETAREVKPYDGRSKLKEKCGASCDTDGPKTIDKKLPGGKLSTETSKSASKRYDKIEMRTDVENLKRALPGKTDQAENSFNKDRSSPFPNSQRMKDEMLANCTLPASNVNGNDLLIVDKSQGDNVMKASKQIRNDNQTGGREISSVHAVTNGHRIRGVDALSPSKKESSSQAATNALKEAKDLKHLADRLKSAGSNLESTGYYFQAALKFLHGASLLESCGIESAKHGEMLQSMRIYSSTAKLCGFCAHEFEKAKHMAAAALAYKCMEAACMRVVFSSHNSANRYRHELQTALQVVPPGESPSSSASDVDNLNHQTALEKIATSKGTSSPQIAGSQIITAQSRPNLMHLLNFTQEVHFAMDASRKSRIAFAAANGDVREIQCKEGIHCIKEALDFNFQDVEGLLRLVRLAMKAINH